MTRSMVILVAAGLSLALAPAAVAKTCKPSVNGFSSPGPIREVAKSLAMAKWKIVVTQKYTLQYSNWGNASSKSVTCTTKTTALGTNKYTCKAKAKPCIH